MDSPNVYFAARAVMAVTSGLALVVVYRLARRLSPAVAVTAVLLLAFLPRFVNQTTEVRPDVPALVAWLGTLLALVRWREGPAPAWLWIAGLTLGGALALNLKTAYGAVGVAAVVALGSRGHGAGAIRRASEPTWPAWWRGPPSCRGPSLGQCGSMADGRRSERSAPRSWSGTCGSSTSGRSCR